MNAKDVSFLAFCFLYFEEESSERICVRDARKKEMAERERLREERKEEEDGISVGHSHCFWV